jgi:hypothetical protein
VGGREGMGPIVMKMSMGVMMITRKDTVIIARIPMTTRTIDMETVIKGEATTTIITGMIESTPQR